MEHTPWFLYQSGCGSQHVVPCSSLIPQSIQDKLMSLCQGWLWARSACSELHCLWKEDSDRSSPGLQSRCRVTHAFLLSAMDNLQERAVHIRKVLLVLPKPTLIIMRYLFAFLNQWVAFTVEKCGFVNVKVALTTQDFHRDLCLIIHPNRHLTEHLPYANCSARLLKIQC